MRFELDYLVHTVVIRCQPICRILCFPFTANINSVIYDSSYTFFMLGNEGMFVCGKLSCG